MDTMLLALTLASVTAALGFGVVAWRMRDDASRASAARVAALAAAMDAADPAIPVRSGSEPVPVAVASMFDTNSGDAVRGRPLMRVAVVAGLAIALVVIAAMANRNHAEPGAANVSAAPLELVSMGHTRDGRTLRVTGLVRNPRAGAPLTRIAAVVFAFDRSGSFVASGRAALDYTMLEPGDESPFVVSVPNLAEVGRYRVSFRTESGILRHIDRRAVQVSVN